MKWVTNQAQEVCLEHQYVNDDKRLTINTGVTSSQPIERRLTQDDIVEIGLFPEDWSDDSAIDDRIKAAARRIF
ncbi:MAG: hypothetical protein V2I33_08730 [Kangiellaceae bacterium]|jgi:hypothetical protein|nr:hypothetical protein [Kangiellaceae bacterium]